jgi:hypothetical protein
MDGTLTDTYIFGYTHNNGAQDAYVELGYSDFGSGSLEEMQAPLSNGTAVKAHAILYSAAFAILDGPADFVSVFGDFALWNLVMRISGSGGGNIDQVLAAVKHTYTNS